MKNASMLYINIILHVAHYHQQHLNRLFTKIACPGLNVHVIKIL